VAIWSPELGFRMKFKRRQGVDVINNTAKAWFDFTGAITKESPPKSLVHLASRDLVSAPTLSFLSFMRISFMNLVIGCAVRLVIVIRWTIYTDR
jgi:hypothetical protein